MSRVFPQYRPLDDVTEEGFPDEKTDQEFLEPRTWRRGKRNYVFNGAFIFSVFINVILLYHVLSTQSRRVECEFQEQLSPIARLPYDTPMIWAEDTSYVAENETERDLTWDAIDTDPVSVTLSPEEISKYNLVPSQSFPWDQSRSLYFLNAYHLLHCLKTVYRAYRRIDLNGRFIPEDHVFHCLDNLRQYVMCHADDTPLTKATDLIGEGQPIQCRSLDRLRDWARTPERNPCYQMVNDYAGTQNTLEKYSFCPEDSPYRKTMHRYFQKFGHDVMFNDPVNEANLRGPKELVV